MLKVLVYGYLTNQYSSRKIEANANRYTFVWGKAIKYNRERIKGQLQDLWSYAEEVAKEEMEHNEPESFEEIDTEKETQAIEQINQALAGKHPESIYPDIHTSPKSDRC